MSRQSLQLFESNNPSQSEVTVLSQVWKMLSMYLMFNTASRFLLPYKSWLFLIFVLANICHLVLFLDASRHDASILMICLNKPGAGMFN